MGRLNWLGSLAIGSVVFALFLILLGHLGLAVGVGLVVVIAGLIGLPRILPPVKLGQGQDGQAVAAELAGVAEKIKRIEGLARGFSQASAREKALKVVDIMKRILQDFYDDPADMRRAQTFLVYHVDATENVFRRYHDLHGKNLSDPGIVSSLRKSEELFSTMARAYERLLVSLLENDVLDLDVDIKTLEGEFLAEGVTIQRQEKSEK